MFRLICLSLLVLFWSAASPAEECLEESAEASPPASEAAAEDPLAGLTMDDLSPRVSLTRQEFLDMGEELVARVGGEEIRKKNVWEVFKVSPLTESVPPFNEKLLDQAVERELIYLEALRRELDKSEEFSRRLAEKEQARWKRRVPEVARVREGTVLLEAAQKFPPQLPDEEEVEAIFPQARSLYPPENDDEAVRADIRKLLVIKPAMSAYQDWLAGLLARAEVTVTGEPLDLEGIAASIRGYSLEQGLKGQIAGENEARMLWEQVRALAPRCGEKSETVILVNGEPISVPARPVEAVEEDGGAKVDEKDPARELFTAVKQYLIAQDARDRGLLPPEKTVWETPFKKSILISLALSQVVEEAPEAEVSKEEAAAFYRDHPMYHNMTMEGIQARMIPRIKSEKRRRNAIERLKERFPVEILIGRE